MKASPRDRFLDLDLILNFMLNLDLGRPRLATVNFDPNTNWMRMSERMKVAKRKEEKNKQCWDENE